MKKIYGCININENERLKSSSGGIYPIIANHVISLGGVVYAVVYNEDFETEHIRIDDICNISRSCGSKYIPSKLGDTFKKIKIDLEKHIPVLFVGTPCQCAGLQSFLGKKYKNLYCVDFICHGVPSKKAWRKYIEKFNDLKYINMRDKSKGWSNYNYSWRLVFSNYEKIINQHDISFMKGFVTNLYLRPSCYFCHFKGDNRSSDITLGDFWCIWNEVPEFNDDKGVSLIIVNSQNGEKIINDIMNNIKLIEVDESIIKKYNPSFYESAEINKKRKLFFRLLDLNLTFDDIINKTTEISNFEKIRNLVFSLKRRFK